MIHNFKDLLKGFGTIFPFEECVLNNDAEIFEGRENYICVIYDENDPDYFQIVKAIPYMDVDYNDDGEIIIDNNKRWGWIDSGGSYYPNFENPSIGGNWKVIGFSKYIE